MTRRLSTVLLISLLAVAFVAMSAFAAKAPLPKVRLLADPMKSATYSFAGGETGNPQPSKGTTESVTLGTAQASVSPGVVVGDTWYEYQRNGSMRRMVAYGGPGRHGGNTGLNPIVHFHWMYMAQEADF
jgi:hypothetical protein